MKRARDYFAEESGGPYQPRPGDKYYGAALGDAPTFPNWLPFIGGPMQGKMLWIARKEWRLQFPKPVKVEVADWSHRDPTERTPLDWYVYEMKQLTTNGGAVFWGYLLMDDDRAPERIPCCVDLTESEIVLIARRMASYVGYNIRREKDQKDWTAADRLSFHFLRGILRMTEV